MLVCLFLMSHFHSLFKAEGRTDEIPSAAVPFCFFLHFFFLRCEKENNGRDVGWGGTWEEEGREVGGRKQSGGLRASIIFTTPAEELIFKHSNNPSPASAALLSQATIFFTCGNTMIFFLPAVHNFPFSP